MLVGNIFSQKTGGNNLPEYLELAAKQNPNLLAKFNEYQATLQMIPQVNSLPDPEVSLGYFIKPKEELMGNLVADIRLMQMFPWFGVLGNSKNEATQMAKAKFEEFSEIRNRLFYDVKASYYQLYRLNKEISFAEDNLKILHTYEQISLVKFRTAGGAATAVSSPSGMSSGGSSATSGTGMSGGMGQSSPNTPQSSNSSSIAPMNAMPAGKGMVDVLRVQMEIRELENQLAYLVDKKRALQTAFNSLLNRNESSTVALPDSLPTTTFLADTASIRQAVLADNPMLKMYAAEQESYQAKMAKSKAMGYPMVGIGLDYMLLKARPGDEMAMGKDMVMPMVTFTVPIYRKKYTAMRREAEYQFKASVQKQQNTRNELRVMVENALLDLKDAERRIAQYQWEMKLTQQSLGVLMAGYRTSGSDFEEVLRMQQKLLDYRFKAVDAEANQLTAVANIEYLMAKTIVRNEK